MRSFYLAWFGLMVSQLGSGLSSFALSVWVYRRTGSATALSFVQFFATVPMIVCFPIAGALVDRWDRLRTLMLSEAGSALAPLALAALMATGRLEIWPVYVAVAVSACFGAFQFPAFSAATTLLVPKGQLGRAAGVAQLGVGVAQLSAPALGGALFPAIGLRGIFLIDLGTFVVALALLRFVRVPRPPDGGAAGGAGRGPFWHEAAYGWRYILARPGLLGLVLLIGVGNYVGAAVVALAPPLILSFADPIVLGRVLSAAGVGMLVGAVVMSVWGGPARQVRGVFAGLLLVAVPTAVAGLAPSALLIGAAACVGAAGSPVLAASSQAIWQRKVPADVQGRVFGARAMIALSFGPLAYATSGPLADYVFNPLLVEGGPLAASAGAVFGVGPARGIGLLFAVLGVAGVVALVAAYFYEPLRRVESELPDSPSGGASDSTDVAGAAGSRGGAAAAGASLEQGLQGREEILAGSPPLTCEAAPGFGRRGVPLGGSTRARALDDAGESTAPVPRRFTGERR